MYKFDGMTLSGKKISNNKLGAYVQQLLYSFTSFTFTNASITGTSGPTLSNCLSSYNTGTYTWLSNTSYFNVVTQGIQLWTVPKAGTYTIRAVGAGGGTGAYAGGKGADLTGTFSLTYGQVLKILVGQLGGNWGGYGGSQGGGGGGTFVTDSSNNSLIIAGGGGGGAYSGATDSIINASLTTTGQQGWNGSGNSAVGTAATSGNGGVCYDKSGGGGGGLTGNGGSSTYGSGPNYGMGGFSFTNGGGGAIYGNALGGFGGGGSGDWIYWTGAGGAGGYSGGAGGYYFGHGGGGGSYNGGSSTSAALYSSVAHGFVTITAL